MYIKVQALSLYVSALFFSSYLIFEEDKTPSLIFIDLIFAVVLVFNMSHRSSKPSRSSQVRCIEDDGSMSDTTYDSLDYYDYYDEYYDDEYYDDCYDFSSDSSSLTSAILSHILLYGKGKSHRERKEHLVMPVDPTISAINALELVAEEEREKKRAENKRIKKQRRREKKKEKALRELNVNSQCDEEKEDLEKVKIHSENEDESLDQNSAFVSNAVAKAKIKIHNKKETKKQLLLQETTENVEMTSEQLAVEGYKLASSGEWKLAIKLFSRAIKLVASDPRYFNNRSFCYCQLGNFENALQDATKAIEFDPNNPKGYYRLGEALSGLKRYKEAQEAFEKVILLDSDCDDARRELEEVKRLIEGPHDIPAVEEAVYPLSQTAILPNKGREMTNYPNKISSVSPQKSTEDSLNPEGHLSLWVGNLSSTVTEKQIYNLFVKCGAILGVKHIPEKNCAFVNYRTRTAPGRAMQELQGAQLDGKHIIINYPRKIQSDAAAIQPSRKPAQIKIKGPRNDTECYFWRTTGCSYGLQCRFMHIPEHQGIDRKL